jgi:hypothetical protein
MSILFIFHYIFLRLAKQSQFISRRNVVYFITWPFLVRKILTLYINDVLLFKCPGPVVNELCVDSFWIVLNYCDFLFSWAFDRWRWDRVIYEATCFDLLIRSSSGLLTIESKDTIYVLGSQLVYVTKMHFNNVNMPGSQRVYSILW